jgi:tetratricopeptide (TPR) repeat protein
MEKPEFGTPGTVEEYFRRAVGKAEQGDLQGAIDGYTEALGLGPKNAAAYYDRGALRARLGQQEDALADLQQAADLSRAHGDMEHYQQVVETLRRVRGEFPSP